MLAVRGESALALAAALLVISRVSAGVAQEIYMPADLEYESLRTALDGPADTGSQSDCILALPEMVAQPDLYGAPGRPAVCIGPQDVASALDEAARLVRAHGGHPGVDSYPSASKAEEQSSERPSALDIIGSAQLVTQASRVLASKFRLTEPEVLYELPKINAANSPALAAICPDFLKENISCFADDHAGAADFRSLSGFCNNAHNRSWGSARSAMVRFLAPAYQDAVWAPRVAADGSPLPSARVVSFVLHQDAPECDNRNSMLGVVWGQFINHDVNLGVRLTDEAEALRNLDCCKQTAPATGDDKGRPCDCFPIEIPEDDPFYGYFGQKCMNFVRLSPSLQPGCSMGPAQAMNKHSSYVDGSSVYGSSAATLKRLRAYQGGLLRSQPVPTAVPTTIVAPPAVEQGAQGDLYAYASRPASVAAAPRQPGPSYLVLDESEAHPGSGPQQPLFKDLLPPNVHAPDVGCERRNRPKELHCFDAGDTRANEQIQLASLHTVMMREHNRLARGLAAVNPHWQDERLFQEARKLVAAQIQHITFSEFLPLVVGGAAMRQLGLQLAPPGQHFHGYDPKINAGIRVEFQAAAFRYGHSLVPGHIERFNKFHQMIESVRLSKLLKQPFDLYFPGVLDTYIMGLADQRSGRMDASLTTEVANHLFEKPGSFFGMDLAAINIQRAREMGVQGYNAYRELCGLARARTFADLAGSFSNKTLLRMGQLYKHVDDIDLFTGGVAEYPAPGALIGPTFGCLIIRQAALLRAGDRFWYENPHQFNMGQLEEIRRHSSAKLLCDNSDELQDIQTNAMQMPNLSTNPRVACSSLPSIDLGKWREARPDESLREDQPASFKEPHHLRDGLAEVTLRKRTSNLRGPLSVTSSGHLTLLVQALQRYQKDQNQYEPKLPHDSMKSFSHFVDHLVETTNYWAG